LGVVCENCLQLAKLNDAKVALHLKEDQDKLFNSLKAAFKLAGGGNAPMDVVLGDSLAASMRLASPVESKDATGRESLSWDEEDDEISEKEHCEMRIDRETFIEQMNKAKVKEIFALCEIPNDDVEELYEMLDDDKSGDITWAEFYDGCTKIRGDARGDDLFRLAARVLKAMQHTNRLARTLKRQDDTLGRVCNQVEDLWQGYYNPKNKSTQNVVLQKVKDNTAASQGGKTDLLRRSITNPTLVPKPQRRTTLQEKYVKQRDSLR
jgi:Ca2+-binding EF-hand superfamily protein